MSNYVKSTNFTAKDSLPTGDTNKVIRGSEFDTEFDAIATATGTKADLAGPTFTGTATFANLTATGTVNLTGATVSNLGTVTTVDIDGGTIDGATVDSYQIFSGRMDVMTIDETGETCSITLTAENRLIDLERPRVRRYTSEDQKSLHPNDKGFDFVNSLQEAEIKWGG